MIIRGGENIQPTEIENYICSMDQVQDCYVIGVPSKRLGKLKMQCQIGDIDFGVTLWPSPKFQPDFELQWNQVL